MQVVRPLLSLKTGTARGRQVATTLWEVQDLSGSLPLLFREIDSRHVGLRSNKVYCFANLVATLESEGLQLRTSPFTDIHPLES